MDGGSDGGMVGGTKKNKKTTTTYIITEPATHKLQIHLHLPALKSVDKNKISFLQLTSKSLI